MTDVKEAVANWLNEQVEIFKKTIKYHTLEIGDLYVSNINMPSLTQPYTNETFRERGVHLSDVRPVAKILDLSIQRFEGDVEETEYPIELQIRWNDVIFFSIHSVEDVD